MAKQLHHRTYTGEVPAIINLCLDLLPLCISEQGGMTPVGGFQKMHMQIQYHIVDKFEAT